MLGSLKMYLRLVLRAVAYTCLPLFATALLALFTPAGAVASTSDSYAYPIEDGIAATVVGTPAELVFALPADVPFEVHTLSIFPDRKVPKAFWYARGLRYGFLPHKGERRPLIFVIAGTGAGYNSAKVVSLAKAFYAAGFHVLTFSSPTHFNFLVNASNTHLPGFPQDDAEDLYRVMGAAYDKVRDEIEVSDFYLTGYSLGGFNAAFLAKLDEERKAFDFRKVLLINPPVDLYHSVDILDHMLIDNVPGGVSHTGDFLNRVIARLSDIYSRNDALHFDGDFLYSVYEELRAESERSGDSLRFEQKSAAALIGISFRIASASMVFGADVINKSGYIVSPDAKIGRYDSLADYARASHHVAFTEYIQDMLVPVLEKERPGLSAEQLIAQARLQAIEPYLRSSDKIGVVTNADEIILAPGELAYLEQLFGSRIHVYPRGGHCGNIDYRENVQYMLDFFDAHKVSP